MCSHMFGDTMPMSEDALVCQCAMAVDKHESTRKQTFPVLFK